MNDAEDFAGLRQWLLDWTREQALPLWGTAGVDTARGGFHEQLDLDGNPVWNVPKRLMVQGRQIYSYSHAALLGWYPDGRALAERAIEYTLKTFQTSPGRWVHSVAADGGPANSALDTYSVAFALLGMAWYHRLTGDAQILGVIDQTLAELDETCGSDRGGYLDAVPRPDAIRRQNPHMHLFEAFVALYDASGQAKYLARAAEMFGVFSTGFFQPASGILCEYMTEDLQPLPDARGLIAEPGHHYEWVWLLRQFQRCSGRDVSKYADALFTHADRHGWDRQGFIIDEVLADGRAHTRSRRTWPHTEGLKASLAQGAHGRAGWQAHSARCIAGLKTGFLGKPLPGGWIDRIDADGSPLTKVMPASTLYHVFCAAGELNAAAEAKTPTSPRRSTRWIAPQWKGAVR